MLVQAKKVREREEAVAAEAKAMRDESGRERERLADELRDANLRVEQLHAETEEAERVRAEAAQSHKSTVAIERALRSRRKQS